MTILVTIAVVGLTATIVWLYVRFYIFDSPERRRRIARHLRTLAIAYVRADSRKQPESRKGLLGDLTEYARSKDRFSRCYALSVLGWTVREAQDDPLTKSVVRELGLALTSEDPFVRHAAAAALLDLGPMARDASDVLGRAARDFETESAGALASRALANLRLRE